MQDSWLVTTVETLLPLAVLISTAFTIFIVTLPSKYSHFNGEEVTDDHFSVNDRKDAERSGYNYFQQHKTDDGKLGVETTIQVVVLGDIGRSPRMQYHALSIASHGGMVNLIGYVESEVHPDIQASRFINIVPITPFPRKFQAKNKLLFLAVAPLKVLWQVWSLYHALGYRTKACKWMLVQNPPSIPTLAVAQFVCFFRKTRLVIDWHNFGYSILALRLGNKYPFVKLAEWYEGFFSRSATAHFAVTDAMTRVLKSKWNIEAVALHDRPPKQFQPMAGIKQLHFRSRLPDLLNCDLDIGSGNWRLVVSSTSWTPDEDFSLFLDALLKYSKAASLNPWHPKLLVIITGKGPLKASYESQIQKLTEQNQLPNVIIKTVWLSIADYASLLGSTDLGISLHKSTSGVDLPMKVVDMLGTGLPVAGWKDFEAWPELVQEGVNGRGFSSAEGLTTILEELFAHDEQQLQRLRQGALRECERRWEEEWMPVAGELFQLRQ